jgi:Ran GTPase-activating protein (RanGAP) involved in mRNA processing and transport
MKASPQHSSHGTAAAAAAAAAVPKTSSSEKMRPESVAFKQENERMTSAAHSTAFSRPITQSPSQSLLRSGHGAVNSRGDAVHTSFTELPPILDKQSSPQSSKHILTKLKSIRERDATLASKSPNKQIIQKYESEGGASFVSFIQNATAVRSTAHGVLYYQRKMGSKNDALESKMAHAKDWFVDKPVEIAREIQMMKPMAIMQEECNSDDVFLTATAVSGEFLDPIEEHTPERMDLRTHEFTNSNVLRALPQIGDKNRRNHVIERLSIDKEAYRPPPPPPPPPPHPLCSIFSGILQREGMRLPRKWLMSEMTSTSGVELIPDGFAEPFVENLNRIMEVYMISHGNSEDKLANEDTQHVSLVRIMDDIFEDFRIGQNLENKAFIYKILYWLPQFVTVAKAPCNGNMHPSKFLWGAFSLICICTSSTLFNKTGKRLPTLQEVCLQTSVDLLQLLKHMRLDDDVYVQNILDSCEQKSAPKRNFSCSQSLVGTPRESLSRQALNAPIAQLMVKEYKERCLSENHAPINQAIVQMTSGKSQDAAKTLALNGYLGGDKCIEQLCSFITVSSDFLETLDLRRNAITDEGVEGLTQVVLKLGKLRSLFLDYNRLGRKGALLIADAMKLMCVSSRKSKSADVKEERSKTPGILVNNAIDRDGLAAITLSWNSMLDVGCAKICRAGMSCPTLTSLDISGNKAATETGNAIGDLLNRSNSLVELRAEWNLFRGKGAAAITSGMISSCSLTHVFLAWNNFGDVNACAALGHALSVNGRLQHLDLTKNQINGRGAALIAEGLAENKNLQVLILDENPLGAVGGRLLIRASPKLNKERELSMLNCNAASAASASAVKDSAVFDPSQPTGSYELDMAEAYSHIVVKHLLVFVGKNAGIFSTQPELEGKRWNPPTAQDVQDEKVKLPDKGILSFKFEMHKSKPAEEDSLNSTDMIMIERLFQLAARGSDREALIFMITSGGTFMKSEHVAFLFQKYMTTPQEQVQLVTKCMFRLLDSEAKDSLIDMLSPEAFAIFKRTTSQYTRLFTPNNPTGRYKLDLSQETDYELLMTLLNARDIAHREMLRRHKAGQPGDLPCNKVTPPEYVFINLKYDTENYELPVSHWQPERRGILEFDYVEANHPSELCSIASEQDVAQFYAPGTALRQQWDDKQAELKYQMEVLQFKLEVERKQKTPVETIDVDVDPEDATEFLESATIAGDEEDASVELSEGASRAAISRPKTSDSVTSKFAKPQTNKRKKVDLLSIEKFEDWEPHVYKALRTLCNEKCLYLKDACDIVSQLKDSALKVEAAICMFRRVRDWHGFEHTVFKRLGRTERIEFTRRIGSHNMYDEVCAVGYYELDLSKAGDRFIMGQLTRLAVLEPGENMVDETYGGINFELPSGEPGAISKCSICIDDPRAAGWCNETPNRGDYTTFYCREAVRNLLTLMLMTNLPRLTARFTNAFAPRIAIPAHTACRERSRKINCPCRNGRYRPILTNFSRLLSNGLKSRSEVASSGSLPRNLPTGKIASTNWTRTAAAVWRE